MAFGMVLTVMEEGQRALHSTNDQLAEAERRLKTLAETDPLTGCFNRRVFRDLVDDLRRGDAARRARWSCWTWTASRRSTTATATPPATRRSGPWPTPSAPGRATPTSPCAGAATSSWSSSPASSEAEGSARRDQITDAIEAGGLSASTGVAAYGDGVDIMNAVESGRRVDVRGQGAAAGAPP